MENLAEQLLQWRTKRNISQQQIADKLKVTQPTICKWESNKQQIPPVYFASILKLMGKTWRNDK